MKRIVSLTVCLLVIMALFSGCGDEKASSTASAGQNNEPVTLTSDGKTSFILVKPENPGMGEMQAADTVFKAFKENMGITLRNRDDSTAKASDVPEIIVGHTNRPESKEAYDMLLNRSNRRSNNYIICVLNGNVVIHAISSKALQAAAEKFAAEYLQLATLDGDLCFVLNDTAEYDTVSINGNSELYGYKIVRSHYCTSYLTQLELEKLEGYLSEEAGYDVPIVEDAYTEPSDKEIIIGNSSRDGANSVTDLDKWEIRVSGSKVYLDGGSDYAISVAAAELVNELKKGNGTLSDGVFKSGSYAETVKNYDSNTFYKYVWGDEFEGSKVDESKWFICRPGTMDSVAYDGLPVYRSTEESTYLKDGKLYMVAMRDENAYYGGFLRTTDMMHFKYGYIEIKQLVPEGDGFWSSLWLNADDYTKNGNIGEGYMVPEIDINETFGESSYVMPTIHRWPTPEGWNCGIPEFNVHSEVYSDLDRKIYCPDGKKFSDDFHTFGCFWDENGIKFTCDGKITSEVKANRDDPRDTEIFHDYVYINLSLAVYLSNSPLKPDATEEEWANTNKYIVDHVRLYQNDKGSIKLF